MKRIVAGFLGAVAIIAAALLILKETKPAWAQTACTVEPQSTLLGFFADNVAAYSITPAMIRDFVCSSVGQDSMTYVNTSSQAINTGTNTQITNWTMVYDRIGTNFNASTGNFTAPVSGTYMVSLDVTYASATWAAGQNVAAYVIANGSTICEAVHEVEASLSTVESAHVSGCVFSLVAGQTAQLWTSQNATAASTDLFGSGNYVRFSLTWVP